MTSTFFPELADNKNILVPCAASTAHEIGDLMYYAGGLQKRFSALVALATEALDQVAVAEAFLGIARQARLVGEVTTGRSSERAIEQDKVVEMPCVSATWDIGELVGATRDGGSALVNQKVAKVTDPAAAIGICTRKGYGAETTVQFRLLGKVAHSVANSIRSAAPSYVSVQYSAPADGILFVAPKAMRVTSITVRPRVIGSDGGAVTAEIRKAASGTAPASGTLLHSGTANLKGTADTNQALTLTATAADLELAAGDAIVIDPTGTTTAATGVITIGLADT